MIIAFGEAVGSGADTFVPASQAEEPQPQPQPETVEAEPEPEPVAAQPEPEAEAEPPKHYAAKSDWVDYAVSQGADRDEAESSTKDELIELYGG